MDPTQKKHPKPHSRRHPDPTIPSSTTIHKISNQFSNLYANHKALSSLKSPNPSSQPCTIDTHFQAKAISSSVIEDSSTTSFRNSNHQLSRSMVEMDKQSLRVKARKVKEKQNKPSKESHEDEKLWKKESEKKKTHEGHVMKKSSLSLSRIQESEIKVSHDENDVKRPSLPLAMGGGRRKSFCSSKTELADFFTCNGVKVVSVDMPPFMQVHAVDFARKTYDSLEKFTSKTLASNLKKEFDGVYGPAWHCIVGTSFGSFVTHSVGGFLYFSMDHKIYVLLFKTTVQRAD